MNLHHVTFICRAADAEEVSVVGDFNDWNPEANPMTREPDGVWRVGLELCHGYHHYYFFVDGKQVLDPNAYGKTRYDNNQYVSLLAVS